MKKSVLVLSSVLATSVFISSSVSAAEKDKEQPKPYSISAIEKALPNVPEHVKHLDFQIEITKEKGTNYLSEEDVLKVDPYILYEIHNEFKDKFESGSYTEDELNRMVADRIKEVSPPISTFDYSIPGFGSLSDAEVALAKKHPVEFTKFSAAAVEAKNRSEDRYSSKHLTEGNGDAFRHALWNTLLVKSLKGSNSVLHGVNRAKVWADAHESTSSGLAKEMDLINNEIGRQYAYTNWNKTNTQNADAIQSMVAQGTMCRIVNGDLVATNGTTGK